MYLRTLFILCFIVLGNTFTSKGQIERIKRSCELNFPSDFISDGQDYFAALKPDQKIEFRTTFFSDNTYRISACSTVKKGKIVFSVYDTDKNLLFTNESFDYTPYWNFTFKSTVTCTIQVDVVGNSSFTPGYVMLLIGYKQ